MLTIKRISINRLKRTRYRLLVSIVVLATVSAIYFGMSAGRAASDKGANAPSFANPTSTVFINEFHYDDSTAAGDTNEFVEVAGPAGTNLTNWSIVLYNGVGGVTYDTDALPLTIPNQQGSYGTVSIAYPTNGIQNGAPDGIALVNNGVLVQFLCYEGTFAATNGAANGQTCTSVGVSETNTTAPGSSLHLVGSGTTYGDFTWAVTTAHTKDAPNTGQAFTGGPPVDVPPTVSSTVPADNALNVAVNANISVTFSEAVTATGSSFQISCASSGAHPFALTGGPTTFTLDSTVDFTQGEVCTVTVVAAQVTDQDGTADQMAVDYVFDFTVVNSAPVAIHTIQGSATTSPLVGQVVTTPGVVTLLKTTTNNIGPASHFFLQTPDANADADPNTSQGILVFTSSVPTVAVGDEVSVTGTVEEFFGMTRITSVTNVSIIDTGNPLPTPVTLTTTILDPSAASAGQPQLEKYEGMRLSAASLTSVAPNDNFFDVDTVITGVPRPFREPGIEIRLPVPPDPTSGLPDPNVPRWDENPERIVIDTNARAGAPLNPYTTSVVFSGVVGPLDFTFGRYRLVTESNPQATANISAVPLPVPLATEFTVGNLNIIFFANATTQKTKASLAIRDIMRSPDIIGHQEINNLASLQALATQINSDTVTAGGSDPMYTAYLIPATAAGTQNVGFLVKSTRVQVNSVTQEELPGCVNTTATCNTYINPVNGQPDVLNDRPPLVLRGVVDPAGSNPIAVIAIVNHTRSFIDIDQDPGDGPRVRAKRKAQSEFLAALLQNLQSNNPATSIISVGDYNAYQFNDGFTDPIATIIGNPTPDDQVVVDQSPDLVNPNFFNLMERVPASERYSFIFEGTPQDIDHIIVNRNASARTTRVAIAHMDADFPASYASDITRPERSTDHDAPVAYFNLTLAPTAADGTVAGTIADAGGSPIAGAVVNLTGTQNRKTITDANGNYRFDNIETSGFYTVTPSRVNYSFGPTSRSFSQLGNSTEAAFTGSPNSVISGTAIDTSEYFVRQHYLDFLSREPDESGFNFWSDQILECGADAGCIERRRINVSAAYFLSVEFQETGGLVDGLYRASFGRAPKYAEFMPDTAAISQNIVVGQGDWQQELAANKRAFIESFVGRAAFQAAWGRISDTGYVDALVANTRVSFSAEEREALVSGLGTGALTRADVLLRVAENDGFVTARRNQSFVMMQYFGYLRRDPDESGHGFWLQKLNHFNGNFEQAEMVKAFINSGEYRARFQR